MKDSYLVPSEKAERLNFIDGIPLRYKGEQVAQLLMSQFFPSCGKFEVNSDIVCMHKIIINFFKNFRFKNHLYIFAFKQLIIIMNVQAVIKAGNAYRMWEKSHPNASKSSKDNAHSISMSKDFENWIISNPSGTLEQFITLRQKQIEYVNSPQYQFDALTSRINYLVDENNSLNNQIEELKEEIIVHEEHESKLFNLSVAFSISTLILLILTIILVRRLKR